MRCGAGLQAAQRLYGTGDTQMAIRLLPKRLIGQTIRGIRGRLGLTQEAFAEAVGVDGGGDEVGRWERGEQNPDAGTLAKIATMGVVDVLVFHDDALAADVPQLTPGEAGELRGILARMETLLGEAREIVERAADRTAVEALEAAVGAPLPAGTGETEVALRAEVALETRPRRSSTAKRSSGKEGGNGRSSRSSGSPGGTGATASRSSGSGNGRSSRSFKPSSDPGGSGNAGSGGESSAGGSTSGGGGRKTSSGGTGSRGGSRGKSRSGSAESGTQG
jgi:transcriptional regulator with XRE-family HTH domain